MNSINVDLIAEIDVRKQIFKYTNMKQHDQLKMELLKCAKAGENDVLTIIFIYFLLFIVCMLRMFESPANNLSSSESE